MKNLYASVFVLLFLAACASHVYENTQVEVVSPIPVVSPSKQKVS